MGATDVESQSFTEGGFGVGSGAIDTSHLPPRAMLRVTRDLLPRGWWSLARLTLASFVGGLSEATVLVLVTLSASALVGNSGNIRFHGLALTRSQAVMLAALALGVRLACGLAVASETGSTAAAAMIRARRHLLQAYLGAAWNTRSSGKLGDLQEVLSSHSEMTAGVVVTFTSALNAVCNVIVFLVSASILNPLAAAGIIVLGAILGLVLRPLARRTRASATDYVRHSQTFASTISELSMLSREVETFGVGEQVRAQLNDQVDDVAHRFGRTRMLVVLTPQLYTTLSLGAVVALLSILNSSGKQSALATIGAIVLLLLRALAGGQLFVQSLQALNERVGYVNSVTRAIERYEADVRPFGNSPVELVGPIVLDDVSFEYRAGEPVLHDLRLAIEAGEAVGVIGPSGSGKSTLVQLLLRLRHPTSGSVLASGVDLREVSEADWAALVAYVPQEPILFTGTIAENIRFWRDIDDAEIEQACRAANIWGEIEVLPAGLQTGIGTIAGGLSGGQRQRVALARALAGGPAMLVLDEPTSALDVISEQRIQETLQSLRGSVTLLIVAHRMSTLAFCDRILVLSEGRVRAFASQSELAGSSEFYDEALRLSGMAP